jgi:hypothetical protein
MNDAPPEFWLRRNLTDKLGLSADCVEWLMLLWQSMQFIDDVVDDDHVPRETAIEAGWNLLCAMPGHPFFQRNSMTLLPVMALQYAKWKASDDAERAKEHGPVAFVWRAGYYDMVMLCVQIEHGTQTALEIGQSVMALYGETYENYMLEMNNA